jgi:hypothetical protein
VVKPAQSETPNDEGTEEAAPVEKAKGDRYEFEGDMSMELGDLLGGIEQEFVDDVDTGKQPDYDKLGALLLALLIGWLVKGFLAKTKELEAEIGVSLDPAEWSALATAWATEYGRNLVNDLTNTTKKVVDRALRVAGDMTQEQIRALLDPAFSAARADAISISETTSSYTASIMAYRDMLKEKYGLDCDLIFETRQDEKVCVVCSELDGTTEEQWGPQGPPPLHNRCRCNLRIRLRVK